MKKTKLLVFLLTLTMSGAMAFAESDNVKTTTETLTITATESKVMGDEISSIKDRLEDVREIDISDMNAKEKKELKKELKRKQSSRGIYIGGGTLLIVILLIAILV
jgi:hypothetical protein